VPTSGVYETLYKSFNALNKEEILVTVSTILLLTAIGVYCIGVLVYLGKISNTLEALKPSHNTRINAIAQVREIGLRTINKPCGYSEFMDYLNWLEQQHNAWDVVRNRPLNERQVFMARMKTEQALDILSNLSACKEAPKYFKTAVEVIRAHIKEARPTANNKQSMAALDIVKRLAAWCEKYPESSTSPWSGIEEFREIERAANEVVKCLNAGN
jgi:hypothetical protein